MDGDASESQLSAPAAPARGGRWSAWWRRRSRWTRRALLTLLIIAILQPIVGFLLVPWVAKRFVVPRIARSLNGDLSLTEVFFNPYTWYLRLDGVILTDPEGQLAAGCTTAEVDFNPLSSLVLPGWRFNDIILTDPFVDAIHAPELGLNIARILRGRDDAARRSSADPDEGLTIPRLIIGGFEIRNGRAELDDRTFPSPVRSHVAGVTFRVEQIDTTPTASGTGREPMHHFEATTESGATIEWTGTLSLDPPVSKGVVVVNDLALPNVAAYATRYTDATVRAGRITLLANYLLAPTERPAPRPEDADEDEIASSATIPPLPPIVRATVARASLSDVEILRPEGTFATLPKVEVEGVEVDALARTMLVAQLTVDGGNLSVDRDREGRLNLVRMIRISESAAGLAPSAAPSAPPSATPSSRLRDRAALRTITDPTQQFVTSLSFLLDDLLGESDGWSVTLEEFQAKRVTIALEDRSTDEPVRATLGETTLTAGPIRTADGFVVPFDASVILNGTPSAARGTLSVPTRTLEATLSTEGLDLRPFAPYLRLIPVDPIDRAELADGHLRARGSLRVATPSADRLDAAWDGAIAIAKLDARARPRGEEAEAIDAASAPTAPGDEQLLALSDAEWLGRASAEIRLSEDQAPAAPTATNTATSSPARSATLTAHAKGMLAVAQFACGRETLRALGFEEGTAETGRVRWEGELDLTHRITNGGAPDAPPDLSIVWTGQALVEAARVVGLALGDARPDASAPATNARGTIIDGELATATLDGRATLARAKQPETNAARTPDAIGGLDGWSLAWQGGAGLQRFDLRTTGATPLTARTERLTLEGEATASLAMSAAAPAEANATDPNGEESRNEPSPTLSIQWKGDASIGSGRGTADVGAADRDAPQRRLAADIEEAVIGGRMSFDHAPTRPVLMRWEVVTSTKRLAVLDGPIASAEASDQAADLPTRSLAHGSARFDGDFELDLNPEGRVLLRLAGVADMESPSIAQSEPTGGTERAPSEGERIDLAAASARFDGSIESDIAADAISVASSASITLAAPSLRDHPAGRASPPRLALTGSEVHLKGDAALRLRGPSRTVTLDGTLAPRGLSVRAATADGPVGLELAEGTIDGSLSVAAEPVPGPTGERTAIDLRIDGAPGVRGVRVGLVEHEDEVIDGEATSPSDASTTTGTLAAAFASLDGQVKGTARLLLASEADAEGARVERLVDGTGDMRLDLALGRIAAHEVEHDVKLTLGPTLDAALTLGLESGASAGRPPASPLVVDGVPASVWHGWSAAVGGVALNGSLRFALADHEHGEERAEDFEDSADAAPLAAFDGSIVAKEAEARTVASVATAPPATPQATPSLASQPDAPPEHSSGTALGATCAQIRYDGRFTIAPSAARSEGTLVVEAAAVRDDLGSATAFPTTPPALRVPRVELDGLRFDTGRRLIEATLLAIDGPEVQRSLDGATAGDPERTQLLRQRLQAFLEGRDDPRAPPQSPNAEPAADAWALRVAEFRLRDGIVRVKGTADGDAAGAPSEVTVDQVALTLRNLSTDGGAPPAAESDASSAPAGTDPTLELSARLVGSGRAAITGELDPFARPIAADLVLEIRDMPLPPIDPLSARAVGWRMQSGRLTSRIPVVIDRGQVRGTLDFTLDNPVTGARSKSPGAPSLPLDFALAVMRDTNDQVKGTIPFTGDATDPSFSLGNLIVQVILNFVGKIATAPFQLLASALAGSADVDLSTIPFEPGSDAIGGEGLRRVDLLIRAMNERPGLAITVRGAVAEVADERAQRLDLLRTIVAKRASNRAGARGTLDQATYRWLVGVLYAELPESAAAGADASKPSFEAMEDALLATVAWDPSMLESLRSRRAEAVVAALTGSGVAGASGSGVAASRVQIASEAPEASDAPRVIIELSLQREPPSGSAPPSDPEIAPPVTPAASVQGAPS